MTAETIYKKLDQIKNLPTLPHVAMEVNRLLENDNTGIDALTGVIQKDQSIAPKILKLVNSAFFGFRSKISSLPHAITLLGYNSVRNAVVTLSVIDAFRGFRDIPEFKISDFWCHAIGVATLCNHMAKNTKLLPPDDAFTAGLIHDMGKVIMTQFFPEMFAAAWQCHRNEKISFYSAEKKALPITHALIGAYLAKRWRLPEKLVSVIRYHHNSRGRMGENRCLMAVSLANRIYLTMNGQGRFELTACELNDSVRAPIIAYLERLPEWYPLIKRDIETAYDFFKKE